MIVIETQLKHISTAIIHGCSVHVDCIMNLYTMYIYISIYKLLTQAVLLFSAMVALSWPVLTTKEAFNCLSTHNNHQKKHLIVQ